MNESCRRYRTIGTAKTLFISIATGLDLASLENFLGPNVPIVRATTSLPAMVGAGVTALVGNAHAGRHGVQIADRLLAPLGQTLLLANEDQMHAVGAIAGSGPACMFALAEGLGRAAESLGLPQSIARRLATTMVSGCGQLLATGDDTTDELRDELVYRSDIAAAALEQLQIHQISVDQLALETSLAVFERSRGSGEGPGGGIYIEGGADLKTA